MSWQLSAPQWDVLAELAHIESYPAPIQIRGHGRTDLERARIKVQVSTDLDRLGLLRGGRIEPDLEAALGLLHRPACWVDSVWLPDASAEHPVRVVAARSGTAGVCAQQHPGQPGATLLETIPADGLATAVARRLPAHPPGTRPAVTVPWESGPARSRAAAAAILDRPHLRAGQIAANLRDAAGRVRRSPVLRWCDHPDGRYQVLLGRTPGGPEWLGVAPADPRRIGDGVRWLLDSLRTG